MQYFINNGGLDAPLWQQFFTCFHALLHGDTAVSMSDGRPVIDHVAERDNCHPIVNDTCFVMKLAIGISGGPMLHWIEIVRSIVSL